MPARPRPNASLWSRLLFSWVAPVLDLSRERVLQSDDFWEVHPLHHTASARQRAAEAWEKSNNNFGVAIWLLCRHSILLSATMNFANALCQLARPLLLGLIVRYVEGTHGVSTGEAWAFVAALFVTSQVSNVLLSHMMFVTRCDIGVTCQAVASALVFAKALRLGLALPPEGDTSPEALPGSKVAPAEAGKGKKKQKHQKATKTRATRAQEVSLVASDAQTFPKGMYWALRTVEFGTIGGASIYLLVARLGVAALAGIGAMVVAVFVQWCIGKAQHKQTTLQQAATDKRVQLIGQALGTIRQLKFSALEEPYLSRINLARGKELGHLKVFRSLWAFNEFVTGATTLLVALTAFATYVRMGNDLTPSVVFVSLSLFSLLRQPMTFVPIIIGQVMRMKVAIDRLSHYLSEEEIEVVEHRPSPSPSIVFRNATLAWRSDLPPTLHNISLDLDPGDKGLLVGVVGVVGNGKSSLVSAALGEMLATEGSVLVNGTVAYAPQKPWIRNASLRENIVLPSGGDGGDIDWKRYNRALDACCLRQDLEQLPNGDQSEIGEKGINLSGGQRQRVSLARAVYADAQIVVLDDPLSALDQHVARQVFERCIRGAMRGKLVVLITHYLHLLPECDRVVVMREGRVAHQGTYGEVHEAGGIPAELLRLGAGRGEEGEDEEEEGEEEAEVEEAEGKARERKGAEGGALRNGEEGEKDEGGLEEPLLAKGTSGADNAHSPKPDGNADHADADAAAAGKLKETQGKVTVEEEAAEGNVERAVYAEFVRLGGGWWLVTSILLSNVLVEGTLALSDWWLTVWIGEGSDADQGYFLGTYAAWCTSSAAAFLARALVFLWCSQLCARRLHDNLLRSVFHAPLLWFDQHPSGRVLNRFAADFFEIEHMLPYFCEHLNQCMARIVMILVATSVVLPWFLAVVPAAAWLFWRLLRRHRASLRQAKRLVGTTRSPVISCFSEMLHGRDTIRGFGVQRMIVDAFAVALDDHSRLTYAMYAVQMWQFVRVGSLATALTTATAAIVVAWKDSLGAGLAGLALNFSLQLAFTMVGATALWVMTEASFTSVERVLEFSSVRSEAARRVPEADPPHEWPQAGRVQISDLTVRYREDLPPVLHGVSVDIAPGQHVGIVGRTGAGKSTLVSALFRVVEHAGGQIVIDGVDISKIGLATLRRQIGVILQEPVMFSGTIRSNLDPFGEHTDEEIWQVLEWATLKTTVEKAPGGLMARVADNGDNWSVGTRQLFCLARILLTNPRVLVLDEATASLDLETDRTIQQMLQTRFTQCTVIIIAHRLHTIMHADTICVFDGGRVVEQGPPNELLRDDKGMFSQLLASMRGSPGK